MMGKPRDSPSDYVAPESEASEPPLASKVAPEDTVSGMSGSSFSPPQSEALPPLGTPLPLTAQVLAATAIDLKALRDTVVDAASVGAGLWVTYIGILFYLLIAAGGVTHRDLFLELPVKLPFLGVDLPLKGFFLLGPILFLVVHAYVLLHIVMLAGKVGIFDSQLHSQIVDDDTKLQLRQQLPSNIFVQLLAGPPENRYGFMGFMLRFIAIVSLILGPISLLVFFELQFLPYHHEQITWWHRIAVLLDLGLLWALWPAIAGGRRLSEAWHVIPRRDIGIMVVLSLIPIVLVGNATFPGEQLDGKNPIAVPWLHKKLVAGEVDFAARKLDSQWSNVLVLPNMDLIDRARFDNEAKIDVASETMSLRKRHLEGAVLNNSTLGKADFTAANLQNAHLDFAEIKGARFDCAGATALVVDGDCTNLQGASLENAQLQGASMSGAQLQGANLHGAQLSGALLFHAQLQAAILKEAVFDGANLNKANFQAAEADGARFFGAQLSADLRGASFASAQLQGARLDRAQLDGADFSNAYVWRTDGGFLQEIPGSAINILLEGKGLRLNKGILVSGQNSAANYMVGSVLGAPCSFSRESTGSALPNCTFTKDVYERVIDEFRQKVPKGARQESGLRLIMSRLDPLDQRFGGLSWAADWKMVEAQNPTEVVKEFQKIRAKIWSDAGCAITGGRYVIAGLTRRLYMPGKEAERESLISNEAWPQLARTFLDEVNCPSARGLNEDTKITLRALASRVP